MYIYIYIYREREREILIIIIIAMIIKRIMKATPQEVRLGGSARC